jgi:lysozyme family protein
VNLNHVKEGLDFVSKWEGGYVDHPNDPGGRTNRGITQFTYDRWRKLKNLEPRHVRELTKEEEVLIYYELYWAPAGCSEMEYPYNIAVFDTAVNCGVGRATHWIKKAADVMAFLKLRENHYIELAKNPKNKVFFKGWMNRLRDLQKLVEIGLAKTAS